MLPLVSHGEYADGTERRTDARPLHYAFCYWRGQRHKTEHPTLIWWYLHIILYLLSHVGHIIITRLIPLYRPWSDRNKIHAKSKRMQNCFVPSPHTRLRWQAQVKFHNYESSIRREKYNRTVTCRDVSVFCTHSHQSTKVKRRQFTSATYMQNELSHFSKHLIAIVPDAVEPKHLAVEL